MLQLGSTGGTHPLHVCFPELFSNIRKTIVIIPFLAGMALYHFTLGMWLPAQTIYRHCNCGTDLFPLLSWGSCVCGKKLHPPLLIAFLEVLPHLALVVSYLMRILAKTQCCAVCNCKQCTISTPTLPLHINEPKFKALLLSAYIYSMAAFVCAEILSLLNM